MKDDRKLFDDRPVIENQCPRCRGHGTVYESYSLGPADGPVSGAPDNAVLGDPRLSSSISECVREALVISRKVLRPVAFQFMDHLVVVHASHDPDAVVKEWWLKQYGETPEQTFARR